ncbi:MAG: glycogen synthase GlgA [Planctomycetota bacterium]|nr:glycogen synthase GlgA [Planctomycetota bacterium]
MNILIASSEVFPFAKTGGLADVCGALPIALSRLDHQPVVVMPAYRCIKTQGFPTEDTGISWELQIGSKPVAGRLLRSTLPGSTVPIYFVHQDDYFDREGIYAEDGHDYDDNCERCVFFCRSILEVVGHLDFPIDLIHCNDWTTGLVPAYLKTEYSNSPVHERIATLFTIHNLAYQGTFWHWDMLLTGLDWKYFNWHQMEFHGNLNLMKTGLVFADAISTVSPRYAREIQASPLGCGLEGLLQHRQRAVSGIINGVDYEKWNPATDAHLAEKYDIESFAEGKAACKAALQHELGLAAEPGRPLIGLVGRLASQKGLDLVVPVIRQLAAENSIQWAILGRGDEQLENQLSNLAIQYPRQVAVQIDFCERLAHQIEAGADMFLMPSQYEPCGLNQLYSLKYGTVPIVRETGGLADTVTDTNQESLAAKTATGFLFSDYSVAALCDCVRRSCQYYNSDPSNWRQIIRTGMSQDWSWHNSAAEYSRLYRRIVSSRQTAATAAVS